MNIHIHVVVALFVVALVSPSGLLQRRAGQRPSLCSALTPVATCQLLEANY